MNPRCTCPQAESTHHHAFGGTYPCEGPASCIQCQPLERQANGRDGIEYPEGSESYIPLGARKGRARRIWDDLETR